MYKNNNRIVDKITQQRKSLANKPDDPSTIQSYTWEKARNNLILKSCPLTSMYMTCVP